MINEHVYKISLLEEKTNMFLRYLNTFHIHHTKYLDRLISKLRLINNIVNEDINLKQNNSLQMKSQSRAYAISLPTIPESEENSIQASHQASNQVFDIVQNISQPINHKAPSDVAPITLNIEEIGESHMFISEV